MLSFLPHLKTLRYADDTLTKSAYISLTTYYTQNFLQRRQRLALTTAIHPFPKTTSAALRVSGVEPNTALLGLAGGYMRLLFLVVSGSIAVALGFSLDCSQNHFLWVLVLDYV